MHIVTSKCMGIYIHWEYSASKTLRKSVSAYTRSWIKPWKHLTIPFNMGHVWQSILYGYTLKWAFTMDTFKQVIKILRLDSRNISPSLWKYDAIRSTWIVMHSMSCFFIFKFWLVWREKNGEPINRQFLSCFQRKHLMSFVVDCVCVCVWLLCQMVCYVRASF